jgi:hypothetical protein
MIRPEDWTGRREPALKEMLKDPIVRALMRRDAIAPRDVKAALASGLARRADRRVGPPTESGSTAA